MAGPRVKEISLYNHVLTDPEGDLWYSTVYRGKCIFLGVFSDKFCVCLRLYKTARRAGLFDVECVPLCVQCSVLVIGAGPAGLAAARQLSNFGSKVSSLLVNNFHFPLCFCIQIIVEVPMFN